MVFNSLFFQDNANTMKIPHGIKQVIAVADNFMSSHKF
jgi:hypothetical protein